MPLSRQETGVSCERQVWNRMGVAGDSCVYFAAATRKKEASVNVANADHADERAVVGDRKAAKVLQPHV
ncbi:hypothetical protein NSPZN2_70216 [Nitrospira defluvii]|uniref:Transposase n=1 Tax=Nitrospira defluvii TaxID=330214 RepID=A0ABM8SAU6_9BACT|nr:hypothetical protein NSPZN2_70216 [Nitrospira defluvii]